MHAGFITTKIEKIPGTIICINNIGSWLMKPGLIKVKLGKPIPVEKVTSLSSKELMEETREQILDLIEYI